MAVNKDKMVKCLECKHGKFMQWMNNPIICECDRLGERFVAESKRFCSRYDEDKSKTPPVVTHYDHY